MVPQFAVVNESERISFDAPKLFSLNANHFLTLFSHDWVYK